MINSKTFFLFFFCSFFSQSVVYGMSDNNSPWEFNGSFAEFLIDPILEQSIFDLEDERGRTDRTPINRFSHYDALKRRMTPLNNPAQSPNTPNKPDSSNSIADFYAKLMNKTERRKSLETPK